MDIGFKKILSTIAPFLGGMVGGPFGAAAGKVVGNLLLGNENASEADIEKALGSATPEQLVELRKVDAEYKIKMAELGIDEKKVAALDRDSARNREIVTKDNVPAILSLLLTFGFFGVLATIMIYPIQPGITAVIDVMLGSLGTAWVSVITYYFGSSYGSLVKTEILSDK